MAYEGSIGVVGGVGPYAGLDLVKKVFDQTQADRDQQHLPLMLFSFPDEIADRPDFLLRGAPVNPGEAIGNIMVQLAKAGATVIGMPCNTAHSPAILKPALEKLHAAAPKVHFVHMIDSVIKSIQEYPGGVSRVGLLSTIATLETRLYQNALESAGFTALFPDDAGRAAVQEAISNHEYGIKAQSSPVTTQARDILVEQARRLVQEQNAQVIILGCTEIPLALPEASLHGVPLIDATSILAGELVRAFAPDKLKP